MNKHVALGMTGFSLIAVTYGMARFSWGIMLPDIRQAIPFTPEVAGIIAACSYVAYCLSVFLASFLTDRFGPRLPAVLAGITAAIGLVILALAYSPLILATGLFIAGLSSGLASPSLAAAVSKRISAERQTQVNTLINAGTSGGIILSVLVLRVMSGNWRMACIVFAVMALFCLFAVLRTLPRERAEQLRSPPRWRVVLAKSGMFRLLVIAFVSGVASAAWWSFGPELLQRHTGLDSAITHMLWLVSGGAGIAAVFTGSAAKRIGMRGVYCCSLVFMAVSLVSLALSHGFAWWLFPVAALNGAGYVILSGVLLVRSAALAEPSPAAGVSLAFLMLAVGQIVGSVAFGQLYGAIGAAGALVVFSGLSGALLFISPEDER